MHKYIGLLIAGMLFTGTINTLLNKLQDLSCVSNCNQPNQKFYEQPIWQTLNMFIGEALCLLVAFVQSFSTKAPGYQLVGDEDIEIAIETETSPQKILMSGGSNLLFMFPTLCDLIATTLMNIGLMFISASIYQMLRGSVVLFTGSFSVLFLGRRHPIYRWFALVVVFMGVAIVGLSGLFGNSSVPIKGSFSGIIFVVLAQCFTAFQFVIEEKIMHHYDVSAMKAVGLEGIFGLLFVGITIPVLHFTLGVSGEPGNMFDMYESFRQITIPAVLIPGIGIIFSISLFNWFGLTVTTSISATARSTIDTCRTLFIWISSLALGWESFKILQVPGFVLLIYGTLVFNDVIEPPAIMGGRKELPVLIDEETQ